MSVGQLPSILSQLATRLGTSVYILGPEVYTASQKRIFATRLFEMCSRSDFAIRYTVGDVTDFLYRLKQGQLHGLQGGSQFALTKPVMPAPESQPVLEDAGVASIALETPLKIITDLATLMGAACCFVNNAQIYTLSLNPISFKELITHLEYEFDQSVLLGLAEAIGSGAWNGRSFHPQKEPTSEAGKIGLKDPSATSRAEFEEAVRMALGHREPNPDDRLWLTWERIEVEPGKYRNGLWISRREPRRARSKGPILILCPLRWMSGGWQLSLAQIWAAPGSFPLKLAATLSESDLPIRLDLTRPDHLETKEDKNSWKERKRNFDRQLNAMKKGKDLKTLAMEDLLDRPVDELPLSHRAANALANQNIKFIGNLVQMTEETLLEYKTLGRTTLREIKNVLVRLGLSLGMKIHWPPSQK